MWPIVLVKSHRQTLALLLMLFTLATCFPAGPFPPETEEPIPMEQPTATPAPQPADAEAALLLGAYWYPWFGPGRQHWEEGYLGEPVLGEYDSADPAVIRQQVAWATGHGIDLLVASWWGRGSKEDTILSTSFPDVIEGSDFRFAVLYETPGLLGMEGGRIRLTDVETQQQLVDDVTYLAKNYLSHPNYLHIDGRPVLYLYLTRTFVGDVQGSMDAVREAVRVETGEPAFIIGDEVYWQSPSSLRIRPYDGVTAYNMHTSVPGIADGFAAKVRAQYAIWARKTAADGVAFIPDILPGFDDTGVRPEAEHPVIPRDETSFATQLRDAIALAHGPVRMVMITSFNEWHEFTSIEPGESFGLTYLEIVRDAVAGTAPSP